MFQPLDDTLAAHPPAFASKTPSTAELQRRLEVDRQDEGTQRSPDRPERKPGFVQDPILKAVGSGAFGLRRVSRLIGMSRGEKKPLGACRHAGRDVTWGYWFPHVGIAVDGEIPAGGQAEVDVKLDWATERGIIYFSPTTNTETPGRVDLKQLASTIAERRGGSA